jgi:hypothetical protein
MKLLVCYDTRINTCKYALPNPRCNIKNRCIAGDEENCMAAYEDEIEISEDTCTDCKYRFLCWTSQ